MVDIVSAFAAKVGQLVVNLATRKGVHVSLGLAESVLNNQVLTLKVTLIRNGKSVQTVETLTTALVEDCPDIAVVADAIHNKLIKTT